jgi:predicted HicB family RNase H-like nuclease
MATNKLTYKGFTGSVEVSLDDECLFGRIQFIDDVVTFEGETTKSLVLAFKAAVDRYVAYCQSTGKPANKPYCGTFNVRVGPELHKACAAQACDKGINLNEFIKQALEAATNKPVEHNHNVKVTLDRDSMTPFLSTGSKEQWGVTNVFH